MMVKSFRNEIKRSVAPLFAPLYKGLGMILMLHRVVELDQSLRINRGSEISPEKLNELIKFFRNRDYDFISMSDIRARMRTMGQRPFVIFTLDDGYIDNLENAFPIFLKNNVPFTIYVTTGLPDGEIIHWHLFLEKYILANEKVEINIAGSIYSYECSNFEGKSRAYFDLRRKLIDAGQEVCTGAICKLMNLSEDELKESSREISLDWNQLKELSKSSLVEIGAHTIGHPSFKFLNDDQIKYEINTSVARLESKLDVRVKHFAYPYGSADEIGRREVSITSMCNIESAVTTRIGNIHKGHSDHMYELPRVYIGPHTELSELEDQVSGKSNFIRDSKNIVKLLD